jgi:hypothetical protein
VALLSACDSCGRLTRTRFGRCPHCGAAKRGGGDVGPVEQRVSAGGSIDDDLGWLWWLLPTCVIVAVLVVLIFDWVVLVLVLLALAALALLVAAMAGLLG